MTFTPKSTAHNFVAFMIMFASCIIGSIAIFCFAIGMETGNRIVTSMMAALVEHAAYVIGLFILFNIVIIGMYWKRKGKNL